MRTFFTFFKLPKKDINPFLILLSAPVLLTIYYYHGNMANFSKIFPALVTHPQAEVFGTLWKFGLFCGLVFIIPVLLVKFGFKASLKDFGFSLGDKKFGFRFVLVAVPLIIVPLIYLGSKVPEVRAEYPLARVLLEKQNLLLLYEFCYAVFYYISWEFFFRGFLLFGLKDRYGDMAAVMIQTVSSCLIHLGKPESEIIGSIFIGILFGVIALRTRSIWYVFIMHAAIGVLLDVFIIFC